MDIDVMFNSVSGLIPQQVGMTVQYMQFALGWLLIEFPPLLLCYQIFTLPSFSPQAWFYCIVLFIFHVSVSYI